MKFNFLTFVRRNRKAKDKISKREVYVFLSCLGISIIIWGLIKFDKLYYGSIEFPIVYTNIPDNKLLINYPDSVLTLNLQSQGFDFFSDKYLSGDQAIYINIGDLKFEKVNGVYKSFLLTSQISSNISRQLSLSNKLISISPDTLSFVFESMKIKSVAVILPDLDLDYEKQYQQYGSITFKPDSVRVYGPASVIEKIDFVSTDKIELKKLKNNQELSMKIISPINNNKLRFSENEIQISIPVSKYTEGSIELPIITIDSLSEFKIKTYPDKVLVTYLVALNDFKRVNVDMFQLGVYYKSDELSANKTLKVEILHQPPFVEIVKIDPERVEYIIGKRHIIN
ncbi:MAG: YbbR-like domain-containing protein [Bacteroidales bacterium]|nr:YbbR-like domain-containing protein [Bacteroidales bacterium]